MSMFLRIFRFNNNSTYYKFKLQYFMIDLKYFLLFQLIYSGLKTLNSNNESLIQASPDDPNTTIAVKEAWVESSFYGLRSAIKNFGVERFKKNCIKVRQA